MTILIRNTELIGKMGDFMVFFGGSKLIQEKVLSEKFYLYAALICAFVAFLSVIELAIVIKSVLPIVMYGVIIVLSWR